MPILTHLSETFQIENIDYSSIRPAIERAKSSIGTLTSLSKSKTADWQTELEQWKEKSSEPLAGLNQDQFLACFALPFLSAVEKNLLERFPDQDVSILSAAVVFNPSSIPTSPAERYLHGRDNITTLATHYGCDIADTLSEWKEVLLAVLNFKKSREFLNFLVSHRSIYPNLGKISCSLLVIPMHSADCERGFSTLGKERTKLRSCLINTSLNSLLMISMEGPPLINRLYAIDAILRHIYGG